MKDNTKIYDVLLLSPWTETVNVNPGYQLIRNEIARYSQKMVSQTLARFLPDAEASDARYGDVVRYQQQYPYCPGLLSIAAVLEQDGWAVKCVCLDLVREKYQGDDWLIQALVDLCAQTTVAVGVTAVTPEFPRAMKILETVKSVAPQLKTMIGGTHVSYEDEEAASSRHVDAVVRFEGEFTARDLMRRWGRGEPIDDVAGISIAHGNRVVRTEPRTLCDLSSLPVPAYHLMDDDMRVRVHVTPTFTRGCPYNCTYCVEADFWSRRLRHKDPKAFVDELEFIAESLGWRFIHIADSTFGINRRETERLCDELDRRKLNAVFSVNVRPNAVSYIGEDLLRRLRALNFIEFYIGMESTSEQLLQQLNRTQDQRELDRTLRFLRDIEVPFVKLYLVIGLPGDTHATMQDTINRVRHYVDAGLAFYATGKFFTPVPGTIEADNHANSNRILTRDWTKFERYNFPPVVEHEILSPYEIESYLMLLQAQQLGIYRRRLGIDADEQTRIRSWVNDTYHKAVYL